MPEVRGRKYLRNVAEVVALLTTKPRTAPELSEMLDVKQDTIKNYLDLLHEAGAVYKRNLRPSPSGRGKPASEYAIQPSRFAKQDHEGIHPNVSLLD